MSEKIEPALRPEEWEYRAKGGTDPWFDDDFDPRGRSAKSCARTIAIANNALPASDRRKLTRGDVLALREYAKTRMGSMARENCERIAAVIESYLPPPEKA